MPLFFFNEYFFPVSIDENQYQKKNKLAISLLKKKNKQIPKGKLHLLLHQINRESFVATDSHPYYSCRFHQSLGAHVVIEILSQAHLWR